MGVFITRTCLHDVKHSKEEGDQMDLFQIINQSLIYTYTVIFTWIVQMYIRCLGLKIPPYKLFAAQYYDFFIMYEYALKQKMS